ncbi:MAG: FAD-dependent oxidoreductase [Anaerolineae bacterium]
MTELCQSKYVDVLAAYPSITYVQGRARLLADVCSCGAGDGGVQVNGRTTYRPARVVVATGASPRIPSIPGIERVKVLTSTEALSLAEQPESLLVVGGRFVALELAQTFARFGT